MHHLEEPFWPSEFLNAARTATRRVLSSLDGHAPFLAQRVSGWLAARCQPDRLEEYFTAIDGLPALALPWWLEWNIRGQVDLAFQTDLMSSTISGYYFVRMLDDVMDGHAVERAALPAMHPFHFGFVSTYHKYFPASHPFWKEFEKLLLSMAEAVACEATLGDFDETQFYRTSARKHVAALIPVAAVCFRYAKLDLLGSWEQFFGEFARWHQMRDDLLDWSSDYNSGCRSYLLCEAERRRTGDETVPAWMARQGFTWAADRMQGWMEQAEATAKTLGSPELIDYLEKRKRSFSESIRELLGAAAAYQKLLELDVSVPQ